MQSDNRFLDDLSRIATSTVGVVSGMGREIEHLIRQKLERALGGLDMIRRDEFDTVKAMAEKARMENEALCARIAALEAVLGDKGPKEKKPLKPKPKAS